MLNGKGVEAYNTHTHIRTHEHAQTHTCAHTHTHTAVPCKWDRCLWYKLEKWRRL